MVSFQEAKRILRRRTPRISPWQKLTHLHRGMIAPISVATTDLPSPGHMRPTTEAELAQLETRPPWASAWCVTHEGIFMPLVAMIGPIGRSYYMAADCPYGCGARHHHGDDEGHCGGHCDPSRAHPWSHVGYWTMPFRALG